MGYLRSGKMDYDGLTTKDRAELEEEMDYYQLPVSTGQLHVRTPVGASYSLDVSPDDTISEIKEKIFGVCGAVPAFSQLSFAFKSLDDGSRTLREYHIPLGSTLYMTELSTTTPRFFL